MSKLSKRERILVILLLVLGLTILPIHYLLTPSYNNWITAKEDLQSAELEKSLVQQKLLSKEQTYDTLIKTRDEFKENRLLPMPDSSNEYIDQLVTTFILDSGLQPINLSISQFEDEESQEELDPGDLAGRLKNSTVIKEFSVSVSVKGSMTNLIELVSMSNDTSYLNIESIECSPAGILNKINYVPEEAQEETLNSIAPEVETNDGDVNPLENYIDNRLSAEVTAESPSPTFDDEIEITFTIYMADGV